MMARKEHSWFNEIVPPGRTTLGDSVGYLDRMIGGGGRCQKQFLLKAPKRDTANKGIKQQKQNNDKPSKQPKEILVDDVKWLEERRKKFPKAGGQQDIRAAQSIPAEDAIVEIPENNLCPPNSDNFPKGDTNTKVLKRKKTLFEMLMDSD